MVLDPSPPPLLYPPTVKETSQRAQQGFRVWLTVHGLEVRVQGLSLTVSALVSGFGFQD